MRCIICKKHIPLGKNKCPYCGRTIEEAKKEKNAIDDDMNDRIYQIDEAYGLNVDFVRMSTEKLEKFFGDIYERFEKDESINKLIQEDFEKLLNHVENIDKELQNRYPVRDELVNKVKSGQSVILDLLNNYNPPQVYAAAFQIRSNTEEQLRDKYNFPYLEVHPFGFKLSYPKMFLTVSQNKDDASKMFYDHLMLNKFVHKSKSNDVIIHQKLPTAEAQVEYLKSAYQLRKKYNLV